MRITRRQFLGLLVFAGAGGAGIVLPAALGQSAGTARSTYLPLVSRGGPTPTNTATRVLPTATATSVQPTATATSVLPTATASNTVTPGDYLTFTDGYGGNILTAQDNLLNSSAPTLNEGAHANFEYSKSQNCLLRFNISAIPAHASCFSATLYMCKSYDVGDGGGLPTVTVYSVAEANKDWVEGTKSLEVAGLGESCWEALAADGSGGIQKPWAGGAYGCGIAGTDLEESPLGSLACGNVATHPAGTVYAISLSPSRVRGWFGATNSNYGILIKTVNGGDHWGQSDHLTHTYWPKLTVQYTVL